MMNRIFILGLLILFIVGTVSAQPTPLPAGQTVRITAETGENYIEWAWKFDNSTILSSPVDIYIDDASNPIVMNYSRSSYLMLTLKPSERHNIAIYDTASQELLGKASATTTITSYVVYFLLALCFVIMIIAFAMQDMVKFILLSIFNIVLTLLSASLASGHGIMPYVFFGITVLTGIILLIQGIPRLREEIDWV